MWITLEGYMNEILLVNRVMKEIFIPSRNYATNYIDSIKESIKCCKKDNFWLNYWCNYHNYSIDQVVTSGRKQLKVLLRKELRG